MRNDTHNKKLRTRIEEFRERLNREDLERRWKLEALDHLLSESESHPDRLHILCQWVKPLVAAGLSLESALALFIEGRFLPN